MNIIHIETTTAKGGASAARKIEAEQGAQFYTAAQCMPWKAHGADYIAVTGTCRNQDDADDWADQAVRAVRFMDHTKLKPSKKRLPANWPFFFDHTRVWRDKYGHIVVTAEPYAAPFEQDRNAMVDWCTKNGWTWEFAPVGAGIHMPTGREIYTRLVVLAPPGGGHVWSVARNAPVH